MKAQVASSAMVLRETPSISAQSICSSVLTSAKRASRSRCPATLCSRRCISRSNSSLGYSSYGQSSAVACRASCAYSARIPGSFRLFRYPCTSVSRSSLTAGLPQQRVKRLQRATLYREGAQRSRYLNSLLVRDGSRGFLEDLFQSQFQGLFPCIFHDADQAR